MLTADSLKIDADEHGFELVVSTIEGGTVRFNIHMCALEFYDEVRRELGPYVREAEWARTAPQPVTVRPISVEDAIEAGYALDDPKSPGYHERMVD